MNVSTPPPMSLANNLWIGRIPWELARLTVPEQLLVSLLHPRVFVFKLFPRDKDVRPEDASLQRAMRGNISTYEQDVAGVAAMVQGRLMPRPASILSSIITITYIGKDVLRKAWLQRTFRVRREVVRQALLWLKRENPKYYGHIDIDERRLELLPEDDVPPEIMDVVRQTTDVGLVDQESAGYVPTDEESNGFPMPQDEGNGGTRGDVTDADPDVIPFQVSGSIDTDLTNLTGNDLMMWGLANLWNKGEEGGYAVRHGSQAVRDLPPLRQETGASLDPGSQRNYFEMAFPCLFPYGTGGVELPRTIAVPFVTHVRWLLQYFDRRFRRHETLPFVAFGILQKRAALQHAHVQIRRKDFERDGRVMASLTAAQLEAARQQEEKGIPITDPAVCILRKHVHATAGRVMGTDQSRYNLRSEIRATGLEHGPPSIWSTWNPSDMNCPLAQVLCGEDIDLDKFDATLGPDKNQRAKNVASDPYAAAKFFHFTVQTILETLAQVKASKFQVEGAPGIFGEVAAYFGTVEAQGRGTLHLHILIWLKNTPTADELKDLFKEETFQSKETGEWGPKRTCGYVNGWHPAILVNGRCNNDCKLLTNGAETKNITFYVTGYAAKKQGRNFNTSAILADTYAYHQNHPNPNYVDELRDNQRLLLFRLVHRINREQELSAAMVISYLMAWGDVYRSHRYTSVYWSSFVTSLLKAFPGLDKADASSTQAVVALDTAVEQLERGDEPTVDKAAGEVEGLLASALQTPEAVENEDNDFVTLNRDLKHIEETWTAAFDEFMRNSSPKVHRLVANIEYPHECRVAADLARAESDIPTDDVVSPGVMPGLDDLALGEGAAVDVGGRTITEESITEIYEKLTPHTEVNHARQAIEIAKGMRIFNRHMSEWTVAGEGMANAVGGDIVNLSMWKEQMKKDVLAQNAEEDPPATSSTSSASTATITQLTAGPASLTSGIMGAAVVPSIAAVGVMTGVHPSILRDDQFRAFDVIRWHLDETLADRNPPPLRMVLYGEGGTGKSKVIQTVTEAFAQRGVKYMLAKTAYTGVAASLIDGKTINTLMSIPVRANGAAMSDRVKTRVQAAWKHKRYLIVDEYSMIPKSLLQAMEKHVSIGKAGSTSYREECTFGGVNVILCGDLHQFPPVAKGKAECLFTQQDAVNDTEHSALGRRIYEEFTTVVVLKEQMRVTDPVWRDVLVHLRRGEMEARHLEVLRSLVLTTSNTGVNFANGPWTEASLVTPRHAVRQKWNQESARKFAADGQQVVFICSAEDTVKQGKDRSQALSVAERYAVACRAAGGKVQQRKNLPREVEIFVGMSVLVTNNLETDLDLTNGARGEIVGITLDADEPPRPAGGVSHDPALPLEDERLEALDRITKAWWTQMGGEERMIAMRAAEATRVNEA
ncbi:hypothetical protein EW026_g7391 [Hermanssonia centrifuga]|uniref:ATP-dependent DNA helicase n=1 Tax=Hermanssonia centrifuga TaxID=98765 RepID=A0A4V3X9F6_9APHY|nr:hypothetical protein EW026_g7391 [Hermanssonia centrifuga]